MAICPALYAFPNIVGVVHGQISLPGADAFVASAIAVGGNHGRHAGRLTSLNITQIVAYIQAVCRRKAQEYILAWLIARASAAADDAQGDTVDVDDDAIPECSADALAVFARNAEAFNALARSRAFQALAMNPSFAAAVQSRDFANAMNRG